MTFFFTLSAKDYTVVSPDKHLTISVSVTDIVQYSVTCEGETVIAPSPVSMTLNSGNVLGTMASVKAVETPSHMEMIPSPLYRKSEVNDTYNGLIIRFRGGYALEFRAFDNAAAYRFITEMDEELSIMEESVNFNFEGDPLCRVPYCISDSSDPFESDFQSRYSTQQLKKLKRGELVYLPVMVSLDNGYKVVITESDVVSYPGMLLTATPSGFMARHAAFPTRTGFASGKLKMSVSARAETIAETEGMRAFPWRIAAVSKEDRDFPVNDIVYLLATPCKLNDISWIRPGKTAWEWWNNWGIRGVDFTTGINDSTYKYIIDFAASQGLEYVTLDEGWLPEGKKEIMSWTPDIDLPELVKYAAERNVGIILWTVSYVLDANLEKAFEKYSGMGVKGFKVDFTNRNDQEALEMLHRIIQTAADYQMIVQIHGMCPPTGLNRTYPNLINVEGVWGMEQTKLNDLDMLENDVTFPFIRMLAGITDYTPGALHNAQPRCFRDIYDSPMSQGTRAHQVAFYAVLDAPLTTLCDSPSEYLKEKETADFICRFPTIWDETRILDGEVGEYIVSARRKDDKWYIGGLTGTEKRTYTLTFPFLQAGKTYTVDLFVDGPNANRFGEDFKIKTLQVRSTDEVNIKMAQGGGFAAIIY